MQPVAIWAGEPAPTLFLDAVAISPLVISLAGCLDTSTAHLVDELLHSFSEHLGNEVSLDLADLDFLGASGLSALLTAQRLIEQHGGSLVLRRPRPIHRRVLQLTGLTDTFRLVDMSGTTAGRCGYPGGSKNCTCG